MPPERIVLALSVAVVDRNGISACVDAGDLAAGILAGSQARAMRMANLRPHSLRLSWRVIGARLIACGSGDRDCEPGYHVLATVLEAEFPHHLSKQLVLGSENVIGSDPLR